MPIIPFSEHTLDRTEASFPSAPNGRHWLGTDDHGHDVLARILYALRVSIIFGILLTASTAIIGILVGVFMGYFGGRIDLLGQRFIEIWSAMPSLFVIIMLSTFIAKSIISLFIILLMVHWVHLVDVVRLEALKTRQRDFVKAAITLGLSHTTIIFRHILPNASNAAITMLPFTLSSSIVILTSLDFLGFGMPFGMATLGDLLMQAKMNIQSPWLTLSAFFVITGLLTLFIFMGEGLREALYPSQS